MKKVEDMTYTDCSNEISKWWVLAKEIPPVSEMTTRQLLVMAQYAIVNCPRPSLHRESGEPYTYSDVILAKYLPECIRRLEAAEAKASILGEDLDLEDMANGAGVDDVEAYEKYGYQG